jgi:hypothetical protein
LRPHRAGLSRQADRQRHAGRPESQAADDEQPDPTMEQAFITLIHDWDKENAHEQ